MPRLSVADCEALLRVIDEHPVASPHALQAAGRLRRRLAQAIRGESGAGPLPTRSQPSQGRDRGALRSCTLHVCTSCRQPGSPREPRESRPGFILYERLRRALAESPLQHRVDVKPAECLSVCPRPCGIALSSRGAWTYLFGDQDPGENTEAILACLSLYAETVDGFMPREDRPKPLRASVLGRIPPFPGEPSCI